MKMTNEQVDRLSKAQNNPYNSSADIMTFTAFCDTQEQLETHIKQYEEYAEKFDKVPQKLKRKVLRGDISLDRAIAN